MMKYTRNRTRLGRADKTNSMRTFLSFSTLGMSQTLRFFFVILFCTLFLRPVIMKSEEEQFSIEISVTYASFDYSAIF